MSKFPLSIAVSILLCVFSACTNSGEKTSVQKNTTPAVSAESATNTANTPVNATPSPEQTTSSPIGKFNFKNFTYPLPRGWQGEMNEITLENGKAPLSMADDERKIGASHVSTKYGDVTGDGQDEALVTLKIETGGSAIPQTVYIFQWKNEKPEIIWYFRTGDRADGGLKTIGAEKGELLIELYGQDRFIFGDVETMKIIGDEEDLCCPKWFTKTRLKWNGRNFLTQGKRLTYSIDNPTASPIENMGDMKAEEEKKNKR